MYRNSVDVTKLIVKSTRKKFIKFYRPVQDLRTSIFLEQSSIYKIHTTVQDKVRNFQEFLLKFRRIMKSSVNFLQLRSQNTCVHNILNNSVKFN